MQASLDLIAPAFNNDALSLCPAHLWPEAVVSLSEPSLLICDEDSRAYLRERMSMDQLNAEFNRIHDLGAQRMEFGIRGLLGLGGARSYQDCGTPIGPIDWLHEHEIKRLNQLRLAMPSNGEEVEAARLRVAQRIAARMQARQSRQAA